MKAATLVGAAIVALAALVAIPITLQSCATASPRHVLTGGITGTKDALQLAQRAADDSVAAGLTSTAQRAALAKDLLPVMTGAKAINDAGLAWVPGAPMPDNLRALINGFGPLVKSVTVNVTDPATQAKIQGYVSQAQAALLTAIALLSSPAPATAPPSTAAPAAAGS